MKKLILYILLLSSVSSVSLFSQPSNLRDSISIQLMNRQYNEVIRLSKQTLRQDSSLTWVWFSMGQANLAILRYKEALSNFLQAKENDPDNLSLSYALGQTYSSLGDYKKAVETYQNILQIDSTQIYARIELAKSYSNIQEYLKALEIFKELVKNHPDNFAYNKELGSTYLKLDSLKTATWFMHNAININNRDQNLITKLATIYNKEGDFRLALNIAKLGRMHDSISTPLISLEGYCNYLLQDYKTAISLFIQARSLGDSSIFTSKYLGISYIYTYNDLEAIPLMEKVFNADSTANNCYYLGMAHYGLAHYDTAYNYFLLTQQLMVPDSSVKASLYKYIAGSLYNMQNYNEALENYLEAYNFEPAEYSVLFNIATIYDFYIPHRKKALKYYEQFLEKSDFEPVDEPIIDKNRVSVSQIAYSRILKIREDMHFEGILEK